MGGRNDPGSDPAGPLDCPPKKFLGWKGCMRGRGPCTMKECECNATLLHISLLTFAEYYPTPTYPYAPL